MDKISAKKSLLLTLLSSMAILTGCAQHYPQSTHQHKSSAPIQQLPADQNPHSKSQQMGQADIRSQDELPTDPPNIFPQAPAKPTLSRSKAEASLYQLAEQQQANAQWVQAAATIERALRINPHAAEGYYQLAQLRFQAGQHAAAEQLVIKALLLAQNHPITNTNNFKLDAWQLMLQVRQQMNNQPGIQEAVRHIELLHREIS